MKRAWTQADFALLDANYANSRTADIALDLGRSERSVYKAADKRGLHKSSEYLASDRSGRIQRGRLHPAMKETQFRPGQPAWNKGTKGVVGVQEGCRATQFKPGRAASEARNYLPIGSHRLSKDGYLERKVTDDPALAPTRRWVAVHRLVWAEKNGAVPDGCAVVFKPGRKTAELQAITPDALECVTRRQLMDRNTVHRLPKEIAALIQLRGALNRQINERMKA